MHYLDGLEKWRCKERYSQAKKALKEIRARAVAEGRPLNPWEEQQVRAWDREAIRAMVLPALLKKLEEIKRDAKRGPLHRLQFKMLEMYAKNGFPGAQELLQKRAEIGVKPRKPFAEIVRAIPRREGEAPGDWVRRIWDECERYETNCPQRLTLELLEQLTSKPTTPEGNLPPAAASNAKSFRTAEGECGNSAKVVSGGSDALV